MIFGHQGLIKLWRVRNGYGGVVLRRRLLSRQHVFKIALPPCRVVPFPPAFDGCVVENHLNHRPEITRGVIDTRPMRLQGRLYIFSANILAIKRLGSAHSVPGTYAIYRTSSQTANQAL